MTILVYQSNETIEAGQPWGRVQKGDSFNDNLQHRDWSIKARKVPLKYLHVLKEFSLWKKTWLVFFKKAIDEHKLPILTFSNLCILFEQRWKFVNNRIAHVQQGRQKKNRENISVDIPMHNINEDDVQQKGRVEIDSWDKMWQNIRIQKFLTWGNRHIFGQSVSSSLGQHPHSFLWRGYFCAGRKWNHLLSWSSWKAGSLPVSNIFASDWRQKSLLVYGRRWESYLLRIWSWKDSFLGDRSEYQGKIQIHIEVS